MGTNYYWQEKAACETCGRPYEAKHIGKSSAGWCFSLRIYPGEGIHDLPDWERVWATPGSSIYDEYGQAVSIENMRKTIADRGRTPDWDRKPFGYDSWEHFHRMNHSAQGPKGLLRHGRGAQAGEGTWDLCAYEFS